MTQLFYLLNLTLKRVVYDGAMNRNKTHKHTSNTYKYLNDDWHRCLGLDCRRTGGVGPGVDADCWCDESRRMTLTPGVWNYCQCAPAQHLVSPQCLHVWECIFKPST